MIFQSYSPKLKLCQIYKIILNYVTLKISREKLKLKCYKKKRSLILKRTKKKQINLFKTEKINIWWSHIIGEFYIFQQMQNPPQTDVLLLKKIYNKSSRQINN